MRLFLISAHDVSKECLESRIYWKNMGVAPETLKSHRISKSHTSKFNIHTTFGKNRLSIYEVLVDSAMATDVSNLATHPTRMATDFAKVAMV